MAEAIDLGRAMLDYLGRGLNERTYAVGRSASEMIEVVIRQGAANGSLGSGNTLRQIELRALEAFEAGFKEAAEFTFNLTESNGPEVVAPLEFFAGRIEGLIMENVKDVAARLGITGEIVPRQVANIQSLLAARKERRIDDFKHGMMGSSRLKKDPVVSIVNSQSNSPGAIQQVGVGTFSQTAFNEHHAPLIAAIDAALASDEFKSLEHANKQGFKDIADVVREEASKSNPDPGKLQRWSTRLLEFTQKAGMKIAENAIIQVLVKIFLG